MKTQLIHIAREEAVLGQMPEVDVPELLQAGLLLPTDDYWRAGMADWKPLSEFVPRDQAQSWLATAKKSLAAATVVAASTAGKLSDQIRAMAEKGGDGVGGTKKKLLEGYLPQLKRTAKEKLGEPTLTKARAAVQNIDLMKKVFGALYDCVPAPVRRFVTEAEFIEFCLDRRSWLLDDYTEI